MNFVFDTKNVVVLETYEYPSISIPVYCNLEFDNIWISDLRKRIENYHNNIKNNDKQVKCILQVNQGSQLFQHEPIGSLEIPFNTQIDQAFLNRQKELLENLSYEINNNLKSRISERKLIYKKANEIKRLQGKTTKLPVIHLE